MKQKFETQIKEISELPERIRKKQTLDTTAALTQQEQRIKELTNRLREQVEKLNFELFTQIMGDELYDATMYYDYYSSTTRGMPEAALKHLFKIPIPIPKLGDFFKNPHYSAQQKKAIEEIIIFAIFLQATSDFYKKLEECSDIYLNYVLGNSSCSDNEATPRITYGISLNYLHLLDNLSYKCNPTVYRLLSALNHIAFWLVLSFLFTLPFALPVMLMSPPLYLVSMAVIWMFVFVCTTTLSLIGMLPLWTEKNGWEESRIHSKWGTNWAHPLPCPVINSSHGFTTTNPTQIGIFPSAFARPAIPAGSSFKAMNRLGFFPFKETANEAIAVAEKVLEANTGSTSVNLPSAFRRHVF